MTQTMTADAVIVGGGHNALVAAAYLGRAGLRTVVLERRDTVGGAAASEFGFDGVPIRLFRYSRLVGLLPDALVHDLGLRVELRSRLTRSFTPINRDGRPTALVVESMPGEATRESFHKLTGSDDEYNAWILLHLQATVLGQVMMASFTEPLPVQKDVRSHIHPALWHDLVERPVGLGLAERFADDDVRGMVAADAVDGTFASLEDPSLATNRTLLYRLVGERTSDWRVPVGGMGAVAVELARVARSAGADLRTGHEVTSIGSDGDDRIVTAHDADGGEVQIVAPWVLSGVAPGVLDRLRGQAEHSAVQGCQLSIHFVVERLPRLRSGIDPRTAFAGTYHVTDGYRELEAAYSQAADGELPHIPPGTLHCHTLTDGSVLSPRLARQGFHSFTFTGVHMPAVLFEDVVGPAKDAAAERVINSVNLHLEDPLESLLAFDRTGRPCIDVQAPQDVEHDLGMPGGDGFHGGLEWPWLDEGFDPETPAQRWGVDTDDPRILLCGAGARRGGFISGIGGHNAAHALLEARSHRH